MAKRSAAERYLESTTILVTLPSVCTVDNKDQSDYQTTIVSIRNSCVFHVGVAAPFAPERAFWTVPWNEHGVIAHRPQTLLDAGDQGVVIALRQIGAAD